MENKQSHLETDFSPPLFFFKLGQEFRPHFLTSLQSLLACSPRPGAKALEEGSRLMSPQWLSRGPAVERVHHVHIFSFPFLQLPQLLGSREGGLESLHRDGSCLEISPIFWGLQGSENANGLARMRAVWREWLTGRISWQPKKDVFGPFLLSLESLSQVLRVSFLSLTLS